MLKEQNIFTRHSVAELNRRQIEDHKHLSMIKRQADVIAEQMLLENAKRQQVEYEQLMRAKKETIQQQLREGLEMKKQFANLDRIH